MKNEDNREQANQMSAVVRGEVERVEKVTVKKHSRAVLYVAGDIAQARVRRIVMNEVDRMHQGERPRPIVIEMPDVEELNIIEEALREAAISERATISNRLDRAVSEMSRNSVGDEMKFSAGFVAKLMREAAEQPAENGFYSGLPLALVTHFDVERTAARARKLIAKAAKPKAKKRR